VAATGVTTRVEIPVETLEVIRAGMRGAKPGVTDLSRRHGSTEARTARIAAQGM